jgi:flagellar FliJ protein
VKPFHFSLERIRNYKAQVLDKEKKVLGVLLRKRDEIAACLRAAERFRDEQHETLQSKQLKGVSMVELNTHNYLLESTRRHIETLQLELQRAEEVAEAQRKIVVALYQEKTGMDKLEEKQREEYQLLEAKVLEGEIMQAITNTLVRKSSA